MGTEDFTARDLSGARFRDVSLRGAVMRGGEVDGLLEIDSPWLLEEPGTLIVNGVDVAPPVDAELDRRFPGRGLRRAETAKGLRKAWAAVEQSWDAAVRRVEAMPAGTADERVDGEWSFAQTLRHLVMATDTWLRKAVQGVERPCHPVGLSDASYAADGADPSVFSRHEPGWDEVLAARAERAGMVRDILGGLTDAELAAGRANPHAPEDGPGCDETVLSCLRTIREEEWEHLRFATRDLDALDRERGRSS